MIIYGGSTGQVLAAQVANKLGAKLGKLEITKFPDGEKYIRYHDKVENEDVVLIHPMGLTPDELFIEYLLICSALKDGKAKSIVTFVPYFAYARQDSRFNPGEPGSFHLVSKIIDDLGIDMIYTIDLHLQRVNDLSELIKNTPTKNLSAVPDIATWIKNNAGLNNPIVLGPDEESEQWAKVAAETIGVDYEIMIKTRYSATEVSITTKEGKPLPVNGKDVVIIDDIISSGGTIIEAVKLVKEAGAGKIVVGCTHPVLRGKTQFDSALANIYNSGVSIVVGTDSVPSQVSYVSIASVIAKTLQNNS
ncbi:MAG: ribose-phosphate pyrophosphokinase [Thaumarchaeota archaeon]|nr:ribose-phosphate pyrophosphokinase [Nitrososphaerota archaeon]|tara:strand:+ start:825 stop:1739 length:915 start_codon:yes stop_codon:yes gene_type:complete